MLYWFLLFITEGIIVLLYNGVKCKRTKNILFVLLVSFTVYFAAFRDGLGMDYSSYKNICEREVLGVLPWAVSEPIYNYMTRFCYETQYSAVVFFLFFAIVTHVSCFYVYKKWSFLPIACMFYLLYTDLYLYSFNVVRQFGSAAMFLLAVYVFFKSSENTTIRVLLAFVFMTFGFFMHRSIAFMIPCFLLGNKNYNPKVLIFLLVGSMVLPVGSLLSLGSFASLIEALNYSIYADGKVAGSNIFSTSNLCLHFIVLLFIISKKKIDRLKNRNDIILFMKLSVLYLVCNNLSSGSILFAYRFALFFSLFLPMLFSFLPKIVDKRWAYIVIFAPIIVLMSFRLYTGDRLTVPEKILPLNSIYDRYYHPYSNPIQQ